MNPNEQTAKAPVPTESNTPNAMERLEKLEAIVKQIEHSLRSGDCYPVQE